MCLVQVLYHTCCSCLFFLASSHAPMGEEWEEEEDRYVHIIQNGSLVLGFLSLVSNSKLQSEPRYTIIGCQMADKVFRLLPMSCWCSGSMLTLRYNSSKICSITSTFVHRSFFTGISILCIFYCSLLTLMPY